MERSSNPCVLWKTSRRTGTRSTRSATCAPGGQERQRGRAVHSNRRSPVRRRLSQSRRHSTRKPSRSTGSRAHPDAARRDRRAPGKFVDTKQYLRQIAKQRQARGEPRAAAECILRLGSLPESDLESKIAGARAAQQIGDGFRAVELLKESRARFSKGQEAQRGASDPGRGRRNRSVRCGAARAARARVPRRRTAKTGARVPQLRDRRR